MSQISNRFYVTALEDGTTLHGNLVSDKSLSQSWNGNTAVPNWTTASEQPTIYLTLLSGGTLVSPSNTFTWYYNGTAIDDTDTRFVKTKKQVTYAGQALEMPALKIVENLASSSNVDMDLITFKGSYTVSGANIDFSSDIQIRISELKIGSKIGVINFVNGISDITDAGQTITLYGRLYNQDSQEESGVTTKWYLNDSTTPTSGKNISVGGKTYANAFQVKEDNVVDHAVVRCEFFINNSNIPIYTSYAAIDDMQDPEYMYIQYNGNNGNAASLRRGDTASFSIWVGRRDDANPISHAEGTNTVYDWSTIKVKLLDGEGTVITASNLATNIPNADGNGWRDLSSTMSNGKASIKIHYDTVNGAGKKNLTGIVIAYSS